MKKKLLAALLASALAAGMLPASACAASSSYTTSNATLIRFTDAAAKASGKYSGCEIDGTDVSITAAGTYVFSGDCDNGSITVKKGVMGVNIVLNGLTLTNDDSAAITLNKTAEASLIAAVARPTRLPTPKAPTTRTRRSRSRAARHLPSAERAR